MQKYLFNALIACFVFLLAGCQSTPQNNPVNNLFRPFGPSYAPRLTLAQSVQNALMRSEDPVIGQIHVQTLQNIVILSGYVKKIRQSDMAEQIARQVPGVQTVENNIIVRQ